MFKVTFAILMAFAGASIAQADQCQDYIKKAIPFADKCLAMSNYDQRAACTSRIGKDAGIPDGMDQTCKSTFDPVRSSYLAKEKAKYPNQASAFGDQSGNNNNGGNQQGNNNGPQMTPEQCNAGIKKAIPFADKCLAMSNFDQRAACTSRIGKDAGLPDGWDQPCRSVLEPVRASYIAKEKAKYPNQGSAFGDQGGNNNGGNQQGNNNNNMPQISPEQCSAFVKKATPYADKCLAVSNFDQRAACTSRIGKDAGLPEGWDQPCRSVLEPVRASYIAKEKAKYPNQGSAFGDQGGNNNGGNQQGNNNGNNNNGPQMTPEQCNAGIKKAIPFADKCLAMSNFDQRAACTSRIGKDAGLPDGWDQPCRSVLEPVRASYIAKEKAKYPNQGSAFGDQGGNNNGGNQQGNNNAPKVDCSKVVNDVRAAANKCIAIKTQPNRKVCFDEIGQTVEKSGAGDSCHSALDPLKSEYMNKEKQAFPKQDSSFN